MACSRANGVTVDMFRLTVRERGEQIIDVAPFADVATATFLAVHPVTRGKIARVHPVVEHHRVGSIGDELTDAPDCRRKAAVEPCQQNGPPRPTRLRKE